MKEVLRLENINKTYQAKNGEIEALKNVNLTVYEGELLSIIGPSGCGKSTLLSIIAGLEPKTSGKLYIDGEETTGISPIETILGISVDFVVNQHRLPFMSGG